MKIASFPGKWRASREKGKREELDRGRGSMYNELPYLFQALFFTPLERDARSRLEF